MARGPIPDYPPDRPTVPDVLDRFRAYHAKHPVWGSLHVVLEDGNWGSASYCRIWALERGDTEGAELASILMQMTTTQRRKLADLA